MELTLRTMNWKRASNLRKLLKPAFYCIAIFLSATLLALPCTVYGPSYQKLQTTAAAHTGTNNEAAPTLMLQPGEDFFGNFGRRYLSGPGSSPPLCTSKCAKCTPCKPVRIPVQPGIPKPAEYYPEAWRCKCRNVLYMP